MNMNANNKYDEAMENPGFTTENSISPIIKVVGVGGGGSNAVNHMYMQDIKGVSFVVCNTDRQALNSSPVPTRLLLGPETCQGLGAGNEPSVAQKAAEESAEQISALFDENTKMVFITAGMGGGTGTGAAPVVARIAREKGVLAVGIVTIPFFFEGKSKIAKALDGADEMSKYVDALMIINNERLTEIYPELDFLTGFAKADDTLSTAARSISDLINVKGRINLDFKDVNTTLRNGGASIISTGYGEGEHRVTKAIQDALDSPLLRNRDVYGSKKILLNFYIDPKADDTFKMEEVNEMSEFMRNVEGEVDVIWGVAFDETLGNKIKIAILASGFSVSLNNEESAPVQRVTTPIAASTSTKVKVASATIEEPAPAPVSVDERIAEEYGSKKVEQHEQEKARARYLVLSNEDIENDRLLEMLESTPTFRRDQEFKTAIKSMQRGSNAPQTTTFSFEQKPQQKPKDTIAFDVD